MMAGKHLIHRSAVTGRYVTVGYATAHPHITVSETVGPVRKALAVLTLATRRRGLDDTEHGVHHATEE
jgi:hypothetical protein